MRAHEYRRRGTAREALQGSRAFSLPEPFLLGPGAWEQGVESLRKLGEPLLLAGERDLLSRFRKALSGAFLEQGLELGLHGLPQGVECSESQAQALVQAAKAKGAKAIVGLGGGKVLDLAKWAGQLSGLPVATLPTSAATCACATSVGVTYLADGSFSAVLDVAPPRLVLADTDILRLAPPRLLAAGLADTLAKAQEWEAVEDPAELAASSGWADAATAREIVWALGAQALSQPDSSAMDRCLEACLQLSARASDLGQAPAAVAHSLVNGFSLSAVLRQRLHGELVAWGLLVQDALLAEMGLPRPAPSGEALAELLVSWGLDLRLPEAALQDCTLDAILEKAMAPDESIHLLPQPVTLPALRKAMQTVLPLAKPA